MPRRKRSRRHKKHNNRNHFGGTELEAFQDDPMRTYTALGSPSIIRAKITDGFKTQTRTPSPLLEITPNLFGSSPIRKRRSLSRESHMGYSGLPIMFNVSENSDNFITNVRACQSSTILELEPQSGSSRPRFRSSSSMAKLHSPGIEKTPLKSEMSTQTFNENLIAETPRVNHEDLLELDYEINLKTQTPLSGYGTPLKRMRMSSNLTPIFDLKDTAVRIQDLNNFHSDQISQKALNCSRILSSDSLKRLKNFNELILNTSQSVDYDNCEGPEEYPDDWVEPQIETTDNNYDLSGEISFFTPQLYNGKSASTPIEKKGGPKVIETNEIIPNKVEIIKEKIKPPEAPKFCSVGVQTTLHEVKFTPVLKIRSYKEKTFSVTKRRSYKSLSPTIMYYKPSPKRDLKVIPIRRVSLEKTESNDTIAAIETCARIIAKIKKYHGKYSSKLPAKIMEICTWLGLTIKKGVTSLYKLYTRQKALNESITEVNSSVCNFYHSQITALKTTVAELNSEVKYLKEVNKEDSEKLSSLCTEVDQLRRELIQFEGLKTKINEIMEREDAKPPILAAPPPPPPPPPPLPILIPANPLINNRPTKVAVRKKENSRPIISLDDILKVKLKKATDRPSPMVRRATDPFVAQSSLKQIKLRPTNSRPQTPSSISGASSLSSSPCSSLTRILANVDTNVRRVKRLQRPNAYSFDDISRRNRRERENCDFD